MDKLSFSRADRSNEVTSTGLHIAPVTALNFDAHVLAIQDIEAAFNAVCAADAHRVTLAHHVTNAQKSLQGLRETKWLVKCRETSTPFREFSFEIGTADLNIGTIVESSGKEVMDPNISEYSDLTTAVEAFCFSSGGNQFDVYEIELVGRNT